MRDFKHWPLLIAAIALIATQVLCTWWSNAALKEAVWSSSNQANYYDDFAKLREAIREVAKNTDSIDRRLMTPGERLRDQREMLDLQRQVDELMNPTHQK